jgi:hypothetical protein
MPFSDEITILRRFLRDPEGHLWDAAYLLTTWNSAAIEIAQKTGFIEHAFAFRYPPAYTWTYMHDWEYNHTEGDRYRCGIFCQQTQTVCTYQWETSYWVTGLDAPEEGTRFTHPWESGYCTTPADPVEVPLHQLFESCRYAAWDESTITPKGEREIAMQDGSYKTRSGFPMHYYHPDREHNTIVLYPRPTSITWNDKSIASDPGVGLDDAGEIITGEDDAFTMRDTGLVIETIDTAGQLFMIFYALPEPVQDVTDDLADWPPYLIRIIRYATLERAYGANTDGFIPTLRDYWKMRKEMSIRAVLEFRMGRMADRDYRLGTTGKARRGSTLRLRDEGLR